MDLNSKKWIHILLLTSVALSMGASDVYGKIDVSEPAMLGGQVTFTITLNRTCSQTDWHYKCGNANQLFYPEDNAIIIENTTGNVNTTYTLTLMKATSTYHKTNISFHCGSEDPVDTVRLDLIDNSKGCGILSVRPSMAEKGSTVQIEYYPSDRKGKQRDYFNMTKNNVTFDTSDERYKLIESSEMGYVLEIKSVTPEDTGDYRVDCGSYYGTTNTASLHITDLSKPDDVTTQCTTPETTNLPAITTDVSLADGLPPNTEKVTFPLLYVVIGSVVSVVVVVVTIAAVYKCMILRRQTRCKDRHAKDTPLRAIPEIVQPEADSSNDGNDGQHMGVEGYPYANVPREPQAGTSGRQVEDQQVEGAAMLVYADLDVESLERRRPHAHPRGNYVPTEYADIDFIRSAGMDRGSNLYANQERVVCIDHESAEYSNC